MKIFISLVILIVAGSISYNIYGACKEKNWHSMLGWILAIILYILIIIKDFKT